MPKFKKEFVHFMWDDKLKGKKVFYAGDIDTLIRDVADGKDMHIVKESGFSDVPFEVNGDSWTFVYYDPYYELKREHEQGKKIQALLPGNIWVIIEDPRWDYPPDQYRIKPDEPKESKPITNRELSKWLAQGNGECKQSDSDMWFSTYHYYWSGEDNTPAEALVRKWGDPDWHEPTRAYLGLEE